MLSKFIPNYYYKTIDEIPYTKLYAEGIRLILTDLDNTLISYAAKEPTPELYAWKEKLEKIGFEIIIVSNSRKNRVSHFAELLGLKYVKFAKKPTTLGLKKALKMASRPYDKKEIVEIGDQLMTDVFASSLFKVTTILVKALDKKTEILPTKINRGLENFVLKLIERRKPRLFQQKLFEYVRDRQ